MSDVRDEQHYIDLGAGRIDCPFESRADNLQFGVDMLRHENAELRARLEAAEAAGAEYIRRTDPLIACGTPDDPTLEQCGKCRACYIAKFENAMEAWKHAQKRAVELEKKLEDWKRNGHIYLAEACRKKDQRIADLEETLRWVKRWPASDNIPYVVEKALSPKDPSSEPDRSCCVRCSQEQHAQCMESDCSCCGKDSGGER